ncbi:hypothetical protein LXL04_012556 [Taraxacum kok-saghyz]
MGSQARQLHKRASPSPISHRYVRFDSDFTQVCPIRFHTGMSDSISHKQASPSHRHIDHEKSMILPLSGRDSPSTIATTPYGSVHVSHGSKITSFDWSLQRKSTTLTQFTAIDSLLALSSDVVAAGA